MHFTILLCISRFSYAFHDTRMHFTILLCAFRILPCTFTILLCAFRILPCTFTILPCAFAIFLCAFTILAYTFTILLCTFRILPCTFTILLCAFAILGCIFRIPHKKSPKQGAFIIAVTNNTTTKQVASVASVQQTVIPLRPYDVTSSNCAIFRYNP